MQCLATAIAEEQSGTSSDNSMVILVDPVLPALCDTCNICKKRMSFDGASAGDKNDYSLSYNIIKCSGLGCRQSIAHLECVFMNIEQIACHACGYIMNLRPAGLGWLIQKLHAGEAEFVGTDTQQDIFNSLESMDSSLIIATLAFHFMTIDEIKILKLMVGKAGMHYPKITAQLDSLILAFHFRCARIGTLLEAISVPQPLVGFLPIIHTVITPCFIRHTNNEQIVALIALFASYWKYNAAYFDSLIKKTVDLFNMACQQPLSNKNIEDLVYELIKSNSCNMLKHLLGRASFTHTLSYSTMHNILAQYIISGHEYGDTSFIPLFIYLNNGSRAARTFKQRIPHFLNLFSHRSDSSAKLVHQKMQSIAEAYVNARHTKDTIGMYMSGLDTAVFDANEEVFCALNTLGAFESVNLIADLIKNRQDTAAACVFRHFPAIWIRSKDKLYIGLAEKAMEAQSLVVLEELLVYLVHIKFCPLYLKAIIESLWESNCQDYIGLMHKARFCKNISWGMGLTNWAFRLAQNNNMLWCISYIEHSLLKNKVKYEEIIKNDSFQMIADTVGRKFRFSAFSHELIKYDTGNDFFIENLLYYFQALLDTFTDMHVIQRLLVEALSVRIRAASINAGMIAAIYELLKNRMHNYFYLNTFYYSLQHHAHRICLKDLIINDLENNGKSINPWVMLDSVERGMLYERMQCEKCSACGCYSYELEFTGCRYCTLMHSTALENLFVMLRYAQSTQ